MGFQPWNRCACEHAKLHQSCLTFCDPMDCSHPGSSVHGDSPGKNTGVGFHAFLQGIFPTQGLNPHPLSLRYCRQRLYPWATREAPQSRQKSLNSALPLTGCMSCTYSLRFQMKPLLGPKRVVVIPLLLTRICPFHFPCHKILNNAFFKPMFSTTFKYKIWEVLC